MKRPTRATLAAAAVAAAATVVVVPIVASATTDPSAVCAPQTAYLTHTQQMVQQSTAVLVAAESLPGATPFQRTHKAALITAAKAGLAAWSAQNTKAQAALIACEVAAKPAVTTTATVTANTTTTATATATATTTTTATVTAAPTFGPMTLAVVGDTACMPDDLTNSGISTGKCDGFSIGDNEAAPPSGSPTPSPAPNTATGMAGAYATVDQIEGWKPAAVALLGDEQYQTAKLSDFQESYDKDYGALKWLTRPAPGNHEYYGNNAKWGGEAPQDGLGYFSYFNGMDANGNPRAWGQAGDYNQGWYSYNLGNWHVISLNVECGAKTFGGTGAAATASSTTCDPTVAGSVAKAETDWLTSDLASDTATCTIAYWHQPTFSASGSTSVEGTKLGGAWWNLLYAHGHAIVLNGHEHLYARFAPMNASGAADSKGIPEFIVGTGGEALDKLPATPAANQVTAQAKAFGALKMTLNDNGTYAWSYQPSSVPVDDANAATDMAFSDSGTATC
ncbi:hypothetical protein Back2_11050 [Nocardioides baekrokdamisoli]|uniref:Uncharacterized protein n=1 Tax=Nocardioides baekrokdamisoli TaxID=1804624 RepID=A0A3G9IZP3_9ACTN|nr:metallophosphoesterase [Nocardioides baekrokdamisoli]BBH16818.1 hypothetical protein Back2_11050 [Nocardioides baekrokdamisoli]